MASEIAVIAQINLASKPFTNRVLPWAITSLLLVVSLVAFVFILRSTGQARGKTASLAAENRILKQEEEVLRKKAEAVKGSLSGEQLLLLTAAHSLVDRKQFSWSRLFIDLETALPGAMRVTRISVRDVAATADRTVAELDLTVVARSSTTITDMITDMDRRGVFTAELRSQNLQKGRGEMGTEYELYVVYRPRTSSIAADNSVANLTLSEQDQTPAKDPNR